MLITENAYTTLFKENKMIENITLATIFIFVPSRSIILQWH